MHVETMVLTSTHLPIHLFVAGMLEEFVPGFASSFDLSVGAQWEGLAIVPVWAEFVS